MSPGGCDIFDPFQAMQAHAAIGLTPGDVYWRTREKVTVDGACKYLVAACTPCECGDLKGTVLGSHEFGGTMLEAAPDVDTGDVVLYAESIPRVCRVCQPGVLSPALCWPYWLRIVFPETTIARHPNGDFRSVYRAKLIGAGLNSYPNSYTGRVSYNSAALCASAGAYAGLTGTYNDVPYCEFVYFLSVSPDGIVRFQLPPRRPLGPPPTPFAILGADEQRFIAGTYYEDGTMSALPTVYFRQEYRIGDITERDGLTIVLPDEGLLVRNAWNASPEYAVRIYSTTIERQIPPASTTAGDLGSASWEMPTWAETNYEGPNFRFVLL